MKFHMTKEWLLSKIGEEEPGGLMAINPYYITDKCTKSLPTLYKKTKTGAIQQWDICVQLSGDDNVFIVTKFGQVGGAIQETEDLIEQGKNLGRANATSKQEQALKEAKSRWEKQIKSGYSENVEKAKLGEEEREGIRPMLAHSFDKHSSKIEFPCGVQAKVDGLRCVAVIENGLCTLQSRTLEPITGAPHIVRDLEELFPKGRVVLDGELFNPDLKFEEIASIVRKQKGLTSGYTKVQYHIYDTVYEGTFEDRFYKSVFLNRKRAVLEEKLHRSLFFLETLIARDLNELQETVSSHKDQGFEGSMARNLKGLYKGTRSYDLQKIKDFMDAEFEIVGVKKGRGKLSEMGIFTCRTVEGKDFDVKCMGSLDSLKAYLECPQEYIGKKLTVKFQNYTDDGIPRFPVGVRIFQEI